MWYPATVYLIPEGGFTEEISAAVHAYQAVFYRKTLRYRWRHSIVSVAFVVVRVFALHGGRCTEESLDE